MTDLPEKLLTRQQAADHLGVTIETLDAYRRNEGLPVIWLSSKTVRIDPVALREWIGDRPDFDEGDLTPAHIKRLNEERKK